MDNQHLIAYLILYNVKVVGAIWDLDRYCLLQFFMTFFVVVVRAFLFWMQLAEASIAKIMAESRGDASEAFAQALQEKVILIS